MKPFSIASLVILAVLYLHTTEVNGSETLVKRTENSQKLFKVFCAATGGNPVNKNLVCRKTTTEEPTLSCKPSTNPMKPRGEVQCKGSLEIPFDDCNDHRKKPKKLFCERNPIPISCKIGPTTTPVNNPPLITCVTLGLKPSITEPQCVASTNLKGPFTGTLQCPQKSKMTFIGSSLKNPCKDKIFCTPPGNKLSGN